MFQHYALSSYALTCGLLKVDEAIKQILAGDLRPESFPPMDLVRQDARRRRAPGWGRNHARCPAEGDLKKGDPQKSLLRG